MKNVLRKMIVVMIFVLSLSSFCLAAKVDLSASIFSDDLELSTEILSPGIQVISDSAIDIKINRQTVTRGSEIVVMGGETLDITADLTSSYQGINGITEGSLSCSHSGLSKGSLKIVNNGISDTITIPTSLEDGTYIVTLSALIEYRYYNPVQPPVASSTMAVSTPISDDSDLPLNPEEKGRVSVSFKITKYTPTVTLKSGNIKLSSNAKQIEANTPISVKVEPTNLVKTIKYKFGSQSTKTIGNNSSFQLPSELENGATYTIKVYVTYLDSFLTQKTYTYQIIANLPTNYAENASASIKIGNTSLTPNNSIEAFLKQDTEAMVQVSNTAELTKIEYHFGSGAFREITSSKKIALPTVAGTYTLTIRLTFSDETYKELSYTITMKNKEEDSATIPELEVELGPIEEPIPVPTVPAVPMGETVVPEVADTPIESGESQEDTTLSGDTVAPTEEVTSGDTNAPTEEVLSGDTNAPTEEVLSGDTNVPTDEVLSGDANVPTDEILSGEESLPSQEQEEETPNISEWAEEEVHAASGDDLIPESIKGKKYTKDITRRDFAAIALRIYEKIVGTPVTLTIQNPFTDTNDEEVMKAFQVGITLGTSQTTFSPDSKITREQMSTMMTRVLQNAKKADETLFVPSNAKRFVDHDAISSYALGSVYYMADVGIIKGVGENRFSAKGNATIEQSLLISERMYKKFKNE